MIAPTQRSTAWSDSSCMRRKASMPLILFVVIGQRFWTQAGLSDTSASFQLGGRQGAMLAKDPTSCSAGQAGPCGAKGAT